MAWHYDWHAPVFPKIKQVSVPADHDVGVHSDSGAKYHVVVRIGCHGPNNLRLHQQREIAQVTERVSHHDRRPTAGANDVRTHQHTHEISHDGLGRADCEPPVAPPGQNATGRTRRTDEGADINVSGTALTSR